MQGGFIPDVVLYFSSSRITHQAGFLLGVELCIRYHQATGIEVGGKAGWCYLFLIEGLLTRVPHTRRANQNKSMVRT